MIAARVAGDTIVRDNDRRIGYIAGMRPPSVLAAIAFAAYAVAPVAAWADPIAVRAAPVDLHTADPGVRSVGRLRYRGGLVLSASDPRFGGFSALVVGADGRRLISVSDRGHWLTADLRYDDAGDLVGVDHQVEMGALVSPTGRALRRLERDAESLARLPDGSLVAAFEHAHRLRRYLGLPNPLVARPRVVPSPRDLLAAPRNGGIEALTRLADGRLLAITETFRVAGGAAAAWIGGRRGWRGLSYALTGDFRPTGAATLPTGDVLMLERSFSPFRGVAARLQIIDAETIDAGRRLSGVEVARLTAPLTVDNFEGVATRRDGSGATLVYLLSDDNFNPLQRTLLMMFELDR